MEKLLKWSVAHQTGDKEAIEKAGTPDPKMLEQLFGGPDEPTLMKQAMIVVSNPEATLENKEVAFDNFEMLIENMDNANNIENLKLWPSVIAQLEPEKPESLRVYAASCVGIAVQNNPKSQEDFSKYDGLSKLVKIASDKSNSKELVLKALFAISSYLRNFSTGVAKFDELNGWNIVNLTTDDHKVVLRILSVISAVLSTGLDEGKEKYIRDDKIVEYLVSILKKDGHAGCIEKSLNIISQLASLNYKFSNIELEGLANGLNDIEELKDDLSHDDYHSAKQIVQ